MYRASSCFCKERQVNTLTGAISTRSCATGSIIPKLTWLCRSRWFGPLMTWRLSRFNRYDDEALRSSKSMN
jgi:hypothetical protein